MQNAHGWSGTGFIVRNLCRGGWEAGANPLLRDAEQKFLGDLSDRPTQIQKRIRMERGEIL